MDNKELLVVDVNIGEKNPIETSSISEVLIQAELELTEINETIDYVKKLKPDCDKTDYILAACSGILCGALDIFLVGKPGDSIAGDAVDKWVEDKVYNFAIRNGYNPRNGKSVSGAIKYLSDKYKIPYDQTGVGDAAKDVFGLSPKSHHFQSLGHNPTILGLFFSILDQFQNTSHFVVGGNLIRLEQAGDGWELRGSNFTTKLWCGFVNWLKHLLSDVAGSGSNKGRGMGLPAPFLAWVNDIMFIKRNLNIPTSEFDENLCNFACQIYEQGYDLRFQTTQAIPVLINELIVRLMYTIRRTIQYLSETEKEERNMGMMWDRCKPFGNPSVKRMLTVAHGTFCAVDIGDATIRGFAAGGGTFNLSEFVMRVNIAGVGRFAISVVGEVKRGNEIRKAEGEARLAEKKKVIVEDYISSLRILYDKYDDEELMHFIDNVKDPERYYEAFNQTVILAKKRNANGYLEDLDDIDAFFMVGKK